MSDGMTDVARDMRRGKALEGYFEAIAEYLKDQTETALQNVVAAAQDADAVPRGYFSGSTNVQAKLQERMQALVQGDASAWAKLLWQCYNSYPHYQNLKALSPYKDKLFVLVDYGMGFATLKGDVQGIFDTLIRKRGWKTYDCDTYAVMMPEPLHEGVEIAWLDCGIGGVRGPRAR